MTFCFRDSLYALIGLGTLGDGESFNFVLFIGDVQIGKACFLTFASKWVD